VKAASHQRNPASILNKTRLGRVLQTVGRLWRAKGKGHGAKRRH
jgi:hypothetical protein